MRTSVVPAPRTPVRLRLSAHPGGGTLDGGWWPWSRNLTTELTELATFFPSWAGRIVQARFSPPDWDAAPPRVDAGGEQVEVGPLPHDDPHVIELTTSDGTVLRVLVVPLTMPSDQGGEALLAASSSHCTHSARCLLEEIAAPSDGDPMDYWTDQGGSWQGDDLIGRPDV